MPQANDPAYLGREQSLIKHEILERYLERFAHIVGSWAPAITYVDGFSGPWNVHADDLSDSSFAIALRQLRKARDTVREVWGRELVIRCFFLEKEDEPFEQLVAFSRAQHDVEVQTLHGSFEDSVDAVVRFIQKGPQGNFPFIFIDPSGWTGFALRRILPLLRLRPCEVLVNFMSGHILRFIESEDRETEDSFEALFGDLSFRACLRGLTGREREDAIVFAYAERLKAAGGFDFVPVAVVPHPEKDRTHFHLVYATRDIRGLEVFKESEQKALQLGETVRADAKRRKRERLSGGQGELFSGGDVPEQRYTVELRQHYCRIARERVLAVIADRHEVPYDELCAEGLRYPSVREQDVRDWISEVAEIIGLAERKRVPKLRHGHVVRLRPRCAPHG